MTADCASVGPATSAPLELTVIAPCFNEEASIDRLADRTLATLGRMRLPAELLLVDDGSADATWARITARAGLDGNVRGIRHPVNRGIERAWRSGLAVARGRLVCLIDADLQNRPEDVERLYEKYRLGGHDIVQAVRHPPERGERSLVYTRGLNALLNTTFGTRLRDNKSGFLLCHRDVLAALLEHRFRYRYYQCFLGVAASLRGFAIGEVDTAFDPRHGGQSFLPHRPIRASFRVLGELIKFRIETWQAQRYVPGLSRLGIERRAPGNGTRDACSRGARRAGAVARLTGGAS